MKETNHHTKDRELSYSDNTKSKRTFKKPCFKFDNYGYCKFGDKCRYIHFEQSHNNQQHNQQMHSFFSRNEGPGGLCEGHDRLLKTCGTSSCLHRVSFIGSATLPTCGSGTYGFSRFSAALGRHKKHNRIRRGKRGKNKTVGKYASQFCNIYYANVNGFRSKSESIKQLIQENGIDILVLTETKVYNKSTT